jgi:hypothetical protein
MQDVGPEVSAHVPAVLPFSCGIYYRTLDPAKRIPAVPLEQV